MILVVTHSTDLGADLVIRQLRDRNARYHRLNTDRLGSPACHVGFAAGAELVDDGMLLPAGAISAVWHRRLAHPAALDRVAPPLRAFAERELATALDGFLDSIAGLQVNPVEADRIAGNRLLQAGRAAAAGLAVPAMLVTQDAVRAQAFAAAQGPVVAKALSFGLLDARTGAATYTTALTPDTDWSGLQVTPCLLQARVPKRHEWRVTTVGDRVFAARTRLDAPVDPDDWRLSADVATLFEPAALPAAVELRLLRLCRAGGLAFATHDLIETPEGAFYFLETNPAGQWGWLELSLGLPIGAALADLLMAGRAGGDGPGET